MAAVVVDQLSHAFGQGAMRREVLQNISLRIEPGEVVLLTGPSGCGKTTLLTLIGALRTVQHGQVSVLGEPLHCLLYTSPSPRDRSLSRMPSSA